MLRDHFLAFDDYLSSPVPMGEGAFVDIRLATSDAHCKRLAAYDKMGVFVVMEEQGGATGLLGISMEHSADGIDFGSKAASLLDEIPWAAYATSVHWASDDGSVPTLNYARLVISTSDAPMPERLRVRIYVAFRDLDAPPEFHYAPPPPSPKVDGPDPRAQTASIHEQGPRGNEPRPQRPPSPAD